MLVLASEMFSANQEHYLETAEKIGELTWRKGLTRDGYGIFEGITGNGYALHSLSRGFTRLKNHQVTSQMREYYE